MLTPWRTVRVFISSTFRDMQAERDHLVRFVFPKLREELLTRRIHLIDVDLRWGVTAEQDSLQVCREIIDECRPRFLCMLGGRYGWVPSIFPLELGTRYGRTQHQTGKSVPDPERLHSVPPSASRQVMGWGVQTNARSIYTKKHTC
ncbi:MAG: DUF4062 domain-containing protein [candidate division NC10 bacterium]